VTLLIFFLVLSIAFSFLCSILEAVLLSVTPSFINQQAQSGSETGKLLVQYKEDIDRPLSAILTLNTIAHTVGAIGVGAQAGAIYGASYFSLFGFEVSYESVIAVLMTLAILILSEIIPKTIGANNWQRLAGFTVRALKVMLFLLRPFVWISQGITKRLKNDKNKPVLTRADFLAMAAMGESSGVLDENESSIINNLMHFRKLRARDIMTPRVVSFMQPETTTVNDFFDADHSKNFSRIPLYGIDKDDVKGLVLKDEIFAAKATGEGDKPLKAYSRKIQMVSDSTPLTVLFTIFTEQREHLLGVRDDFGNLIGLVSLEDLFETLLGKEIVDETDQIVDLQEHAKGLRKE